MLDKTTLLGNGGTMKKIIDRLVTEYNMWRDIIRIGQPFSGMAIILFSGIAILIAVMICRLTL